MAFHIYDLLPPELSVFLAVPSVLDKVHREDRIHIKAKTVNFSWQRGNKIGQVREKDIFHFM